MDVTLTGWSFLKVTSLPLQPCHRLPAEVIFWTDFKTWVKYELFTCQNMLIEGPCLKNTEISP